MPTPENYLRKELYERIRRDESLFEFLQQGSLDGIWYWDIEYPDQEWMSPGFWATLGYDPDTKPHLASAWRDLINPDDLRVALENFQKHCENPEHPYDQVVRYRHQDGSTVWIRCRGIAIRDEAGTPVRMLGAHVDITEQKRAETKLLHKTRELERINRELEAALRKIRTLRGIIPICANCKKIRDDKGFWNQVEQYVQEHTDVEFSHGICPECSVKLYGTRP